jgi:hypothetical protein
MKSVYDDFGKAILFLEIHRNETSAAPFSGPFARMTTCSKTSVSFSDDFVPFNSSELSLSRDRPTVSKRSFLRLEYSFVLWFERIESEMFSNPIPVNLSFVRPAKVFSIPVSSKFRPQDSKRRTVLGNSLAISFDIPETGIRVISSSPPLGNAPPPLGLSTSQIASGIGNSRNTSTEPRPPISPEPIVISASRIGPVIGNSCGPSSELRPPISLESNSVTRPSTPGHPADPFAAKHRNTSSDSIPRRTDSHLSSRPSTALSGASFAEPGKQLWPNDDRHPGFTPGNTDDGFSEPLPQLEPTTLYPPPPVQSESGQLHAYSPARTLSLSQRSSGSSLSQQASPETLQLYSESTSPEVRQVVSPPSSTPSSDGLASASPIQSSSSSIQVIHQAEVELDLSSSDSESPGSAHEDVRFQSFDPRGFEVLNGWTFYPTTAQMRSNYASPATLPLSLRPLEMP